jgi:hypothetical protein
MEDLINLLFQVKNDDFKKEIILKSYPKHIYQPVSKGLKSEKKEAFLKDINKDFLDYLYSLNPLRTKG